MPAQKVGHSRSRVRRPAEERNKPVAVGVLWDMCRVRVLVGALAFILLAAAPALASFRGRDGLLAVQPVSGSGVVLVNLHGAVVQRICGQVSPCAAPGPVSPRWSSDGRSLALSLTDRRFQAPGMSVVYPDGGCLDCEWFGASGAAFGGAFGAAFTADPAVITAVARGSLFEYGVDGIREARLLSGSVTSAVWSSSGEVAVVRDSTVWAGRLGQLRRLGAGRAPSWSPDGSQVALVRHGWVTIEQLQNRAARRLVRGGSPAWSPDGRSIAFLGKKGRLSVIRANGGAPHQLGSTRGRSIDWQPLPSHPAPGCATPPRSVLIASSQDAMVTQDGTRSPFQPTGGPATFMGCLRATGRERLLVRYVFESEDDEPGATGAATAGDYAALATFDTDYHYGGSSNTLDVYDLRTGNPVQNLGGEFVTCDGYSCETRMDHAVINGQGFTAVHTVASVECIDVNSCESIQVSDSGGPRTVDTATTSWVSAPVLTDLALSGDTLTWKHAGTPESIQLH
jgi:hypothetical protein